MKKKKVKKKPRGSQWTPHKLERSTAISGFRMQNWIDQPAAKNTPHEAASAAAVAIIASKAPVLWRPLSV